MTDDPILASADDLRAHLRHTADMYNSIVRALGRRGFHVRVSLGNDGGCQVLSQFTITMTEKAK